MKIEEPNHTCNKYEFYFQIFRFQEYPRFEHLLQNNKDHRYFKNDKLMLSDEIRIINE